jgi:hypothetical protein
VVRCEKSRDILSLRGANRRESRWQPHPSVDLVESARCDSYSPLLLLLLWLLTAGARQSRCLGVVVLHAAALVPSVAARERVSRVAPCAVSRQLNNDPVTPANTGSGRVDLELEANAVVVTRTRI